MLASFTSIKNTLFILFLLSIGLLAADLLLYYQPSTTELTVAHWLRFTDDPWMAPAAHLLSNSIYILGIIAVLTLVILIGRRHWHSATVLTLALISLLSIEPTKDIFHRPRPVYQDLAQTVQLKDFGFPSGHALTSTILVGILAFLLVQWRPTQRTRLMAAVGGAIYVVGVGWSRIYLGAHYPSDVVGGMTLGVGILLALMLLYHRLELRHVQRQLQHDAIPPS